MKTKPTVFYLKFTPEAQEDVKTTAQYYEAQLAGLGKRFRMEVRNQLLLVKQNPFSRAIRYGSVRFAVIDKFPYSIHYTIHQQQITIHAIISDYRNPKEYWKHND